VQGSGVIGPVFVGSPHQQITPWAQKDGRETPGVELEFGIREETAFEVQRDGTIIVELDPILVSAVLIPDPRFVIGDELINADFIVGQVGIEIVTPGISDQGVGGFGQVDNAISGCPRNSHRPCGRLCDGEQVLIWRHLVDLSGRDVVNQQIGGIHACHRFIEKDFDTAQFIHAHPGDWDLGGHHWTGRIGRLHGRVDQG
jgi:hypothetical protein